MAHITGGGITDNLPRILPRGLHAVVDRTSWQVPALFSWLQRTGNVPSDDMLRTFNMGMGLIVVCAPSDEGKVVQLLEEAGEPASRKIGEIRSGGGGGVRYVGG